MDALEWIKLIAEIIVTVGGAITIICTFLKKSLKKATENLVTKADLEEHAKQRKQQIDELNTKINDFRTEFNNKLDKLHTEMTDTDEKVKGNLLSQSRYIFVQAEKTYHGEETIDEHTYDSLCQLFENYKKLGGNGYVHKIMQSLEKKHLGGK